jgi:hypothetical protein
MKKILLASCVAAISAGANAELTPLSEYELHSVTGQAGVDIELDIGIGIDEIRYTDTATNGDGDGGSLAIEDITIGGGAGRTSLFGATDPGNTANLDNLKFAVDILSNGDLQIAGKPVAGFGVGVVDVQLTTGIIETKDINGDAGVRLIDSISMYGGALGLSMLIDGSTNDIAFRAEIGFEDIDIDMSTNGIVITDAYIFGRDWNDDPVASLSDTVADIYVTLRKEGDGVTFDFAPNRSGQNIFDMGIGELSIGGGVIGAIAIDDLSIQGVSMNISGH